MAFEVFGVLLASIIQGVMITIVDPASDCDTTTTARPKSLTNPYFIKTDYSQETSSSNSSSGYSELVMGIFEKTIDFDIFFVIN